MRKKHGLVSLVMAAVILFSVVWYAYACNGCGVYCRFGYGCTDCSCAYDPAKWTYYPDNGEYECKGTYLWLHLDQKFVGKETFTDCYIAWCVLITQKGWSGAPAMFTWTVKYDEANFIHVTYRCLLQDNQCYNTIWRRLSASK